MTALYAIWWGVIGVLRGGAFGAIARRFGWEPGTTWTRIVCAGLAVGPLVEIHPGWIVLWIAVYGGMTIGYFNESMGLEKSDDFGWLALWGVTVAACPIVVVCVFKFALLPMLFACIGALAAPAYAVNKRFGYRYGTDWTQRAEFVTWSMFGLALILAVKI